MINAYKKFWNSYFNFSGISSRKEYWLAWLMNTIIYLILIAVLIVYISVMGIHGTYHEITTVNGSDFNFQISGVGIPIILWIIFIYSLLIVLPSFSISVRRLRDAGFHWAFIFLNMIPTIGSVVLLILHCLPTSEKVEDMTKVKHAKSDEIEKWYKLKEKNAITEDEYELKKKELL